MRSELAWSLVERITLLVPRMIERLQRLQKIRPGITRPGSGQIAVGVRNASAAECADLRIALAVAADRGANQSPRILFNSEDIPAQLQPVNGGVVCASLFPCLAISSPRDLMTTISGLQCKRRPMVRSSTTAFR